MADKDFKKFLEEVQVAAVSSVPMPKMKENSNPNNSTSKLVNNSRTPLAGAKRTASGVTASANQHSSKQKVASAASNKRSKR